MNGRKSATVVAVVVGIHNSVSHALFWIMKEMEKRFAKFTIIDSKFDGMTPEEDSIDVSKSLKPLKKARSPKVVPTEFSTNLTPCNP